MPPKTSQRKSAADNIIKLVRILHKQTQPRVFELSPQLRDNSGNIDELGPLEELQWNKKTKRYQMDKTSKYNEDDAILHAMVMLFVVARLQHGWSHVQTCSKLTIWPVSESNSKVPPDTTLPREWDNELVQLWKQKKMAKKHCNSHQNFNSFASIYTEDYTGFCAWEDRKGGTDYDHDDKTRKGWAPFYEVAEQSVLQWAKEYCKDGNGNESASELALMVIYILVGLPVNNAKERVAVAQTLHDILLDEAIKDNPEHFCSNAIKAIETAVRKEVFETAIKKFCPTSFMEKYLPTVGRDERMKGIFRAWNARYDLEDMVMDGVYPTEPTS